MSRVINGEVHTQSIYISESEPRSFAIYIEGMRTCASLATRADSFDGDEYALVPEMDVYFYADEATHAWEEHRLLLSFALFKPEDTSAIMTDDQLMRYLEYCVPWRW